MYVCVYIYTNLFYVVVYMLLYIIEHIKLYLCIKTTEVTSVAKAAHMVRLRSAEVFSTTCCSYYCYYYYYYCYYYDYYYYYY